MDLLLELAFIAIIAAAVWGGYKKGLLMSVGGIIVIFISIIVGNIVSNTYSQEVVTALRPFASGYVGTLVDEAVYGTLGIDSSEFSVEDLFDQNPDIIETVAKKTLAELGVHDDAAEIMAVQAREYAFENSVNLQVSITEVVCSNIAYIAGFILFFSLCAIILTVIGNISNLSFRIPHIGIANDIGGLVGGFVEGILICTVLAWGLRYAGLIFPDGMLEDSILASFFMNNNLLVSLLKI